MADIVVSDTGAVRILDVYLNGQTQPSAWTYHLYSNNITPVPATGVGAFTETAITGYASVTVNATAWTATTSPTGTTKATATPIAYPLTGSGTVYGYYVTDNGGNLIWSQRFDDTITLGALGGTITLEPSITLESPIP